VGSGNRSQGEQLDNGSCYPAFEVDQKKKDGYPASERKEEERQKFREQTKDTDADKFRIIDETGSNLALVRLYARARDPEKEREV
jgi:hypothetical protein